MQEFLVSSIGQPALSSRLVLGMTSFKLVYIKNNFLQIFEQFHYELRRAAFVRLEFIQDPQYYDISSVEVALASLVHFTANRVKVHEEDSKIETTNLNLFSSDDRDLMLIKKILNTLIEVKNY